jgi:hypothetical protein
MNTIPPQSSFQNNLPGFDSRDSVIFISEGPGDTTVRQLGPQLLQFAKAERERLIRLQELLKQINQESH